MAPVTVILEYRLDAALVPIAEAARLAGVTPQAVRNWISRGYRTADGELVRVPVTMSRGERCVIPLDVLRAEAATRGRGRRRSAA